MIVSYAIKLETAFNVTRLIIVFTRMSIRDVYQK